MVQWPPFVFSDASPGQLRNFFIKQGGRSKINTLSHFKDIIKLGRVYVNVIIFVKLSQAQAQAGLSLALFPNYPATRPDPADLNNTLTSTEQVINKS